MDSWDPGEYMRFSDERTRPSVDLVTRIAVERPATVIDLGCGPGNSTRVLRRRWPEARIIGLDSSPQMIAAARAEEPRGEWILSGIEDWVPATLTHSRRMGACSSPSDGPSWWRTDSRVATHQ